MSINRRLFFCIGFLGLFAASAAESPVVLGRKALDLLLAGKYSEINPFLTPAAKEKLTPAFLRDRAGEEIQGFGDFRQVGTPLVAKSGNDTLVSFPVQFSKVKVNIQFTVAESGKIAGLFFRPADAPLPPQWTRPAYSKPELFREREVTVGEGEWKLPGTLTIPVVKGPFTAVLLVHGAGPNDRDETIFSNRMFKDLAEGLASHNMAVLRYDKRSKVYGQQMGAISYTLQQETVEDAVKALALLRKQPEVNPKRVFVVAHSLGGYSMPRIVAQDGKLAGAVVLAGNSRHVEDVVLDQNEYMLNLRNGGGHDERERMQQLKEEVAKAKALGPGRTVPPVVLGLPGEYLLDLKNYDPAADAKRLAIPLLFLQGQRDMQVTMKDFDGWKTSLASKKNADFKTYPALNHLFMTGKGPADPAEYRQPGNVAPEVIADIVKWIQQN